MVRRLRSLCALVVAWTLLGALPCLAAGQPVVWLALSEPGGAYSEAAAAITAYLARSGTPAEVVSAPWQQFDGKASPKLIVAIGAAALDGIRASGGSHPLLAT